MKAQSAFKSDVRLFFIYFKFISNLLSKAPITEGSAQVFVQVQVAVVSSAAVHNCLHLIKVD